MKTSFIFVMLLAAMSMTLAAYAQRGAGQSAGLSRQGQAPELVELEGTIQSVESGPCKYSVGKAVSGTHLIVVTADKTVNLHLGPTSEVTDYVSGKEGEHVAVIAFQTDKLPEDQYIAKAFTLNGKDFVLRDDDLRPKWAGKYGKEKCRGVMKN